MKGGHLSRQQKSNKSDEIRNSDDRLFPSPIGHRASMGDLPLTHGMGQNRIKDRTSELVHV